MFKRGLIAAAAAASLVSAPAIAQSSSASKLSIAHAARTGASAKGENLFGGGALVGVLVFAAVLGAVYAIASSSDEPNNEPNSP